MFRMVIAAFVVYLLIPDDVSIVTPTSTPVEKVTAGQTLDAANSIISDISGFCGRNEQTCDTGKALLSNAKNVVHSGIQKAKDKSASVTSKEVSPSKPKLNSAAQ